jgi:hypothetical protein
MTKLEITLQKLINDDGFEETKKSLGLTTLELIQKSNCRIDFTMANDVLSDLFREKLFPWKYKNCQLSYDGFSGVVNWECDWSGDYYNDYNDESTSSMATPFWDANNGVPVDTELYKAVDSNNNPILLSEGDLEDNQSNTWIKWDNEFDNLASYSMWIRRFYLPNVYEAISQHLDNYRNYED